MTNEVYLELRETHFNHEIDKTKKTRRRLTYASLFLGAGIALALVANRNEFAQLQFETKATAIGIGVYLEAFPLTSIFLQSQVIKSLKEERDNPPPTEILNILDKKEEVKRLIRGEKESVTLNKDKKK